MPKFAQLMQERTGGKSVSMADSGILSRVKQFVTTGVPPLDLIMGGGLPVGRMMEIYGNTSTGKSLLTAHFLAEFQRIGGIADLIDTESATSVSIMEAVGVNVEDCIYSVPSTVEEVFEHIVDVIDVKAKEAPDSPMIIAWDSVAATTCEDELERAKKDGIGQGYPSHARLISQLCRILVTEIPKNNICFVFINQTRQKLNVLFGDDTATFGGRAIEFYSSIRLATKYRSKLKSSKSAQPYGVMLSIGVVKNKVAPPFGECTIPVVFGQGVDEAGAVFEWFRQRKVATPVGGWYKIMLRDEELKFRKDSFGEVYEEHYEAILQLLEENYYAEPSD